MKHIITVDGDHADYTLESNDGTHLFTYLITRTPDGVEVLNEVLNMPLFEERDLPAAVERIMRAEESWHPLSAESQYFEDRINQAERNNP